MIKQYGFGTPAQAPSWMLSKILRSAKVRWLGTNQEKEYRSPDTDEDWEIALTGFCSSLLFDRRCGDFLRVRSLQWEPGAETSRLEYHSCFISYSSKDAEFGKRLKTDLESRGVQCWFGADDMEIGPLLEQIDEAIRTFDRLLVVLSVHSMASEWVKTEIRRALRRGGQLGKGMLCPIRLVPMEALSSWEFVDYDVGKDLAHEIRGQLIMDFTNWNDDRSYADSLQKLVDRLKINP
jgi:hypothetical protein